MRPPRVVILSLHTSPLAVPGSGDGGGMNVYVRSLATALTRAGVDCDVITRAEHPDQPEVEELEPGLRVFNLEVGPRRAVPKHALAEMTDEFLGRITCLVRDGTIGVDVIHANYWLSGAVGHRLKHELEVPLAVTFHTLARVKAEAGLDDDPELRTQVEHEVIDCSDLVLASTEGERAELGRLYGADASRVEIVPPGVDHGVFYPDDPFAARERLGLDAGPTMLFAGRIQPLKGVDLALSCLDCLDDRSARLVVVGGPSGPEGESTLRGLRSRVDALGLGERVRFVEPQPHHMLAEYYRAADVCIVPSRTESFGLVALEAAACGTPVVAAAVGGLRSLVADGDTGYLVDGHEPCHYAEPVTRLLDDASLRAALGRRAWARSWRYSWSMTAAKLRRLYTDLTVSEPVSCA